MKRVLLFAALIAWSGMAGAVVYKWVDAQGKLQYGDRPPDGVHAEVVELLGTHVAARRAARERRAPSRVANRRAGSAGRRHEEGRGQRRRADTRKAVRRCAGPLQETDRGPPPLQDRRQRRAAVLTSEEIDAERLNAKRDIDAICNSSN